jgi:1,2-dihydroxy-3-keto-5-methylthiopentene dioxygenase
VPGDQRLPHDYSPSQPVELDTLARLGLKHWTIPVDDKYETAINKVALDNGYKNRDQINVSKEGLGDLYEAKIKGFFEESVLLLKSEGLLTFFAV